MNRHAERNDGWLIAGVAGCVIAGAAAIALFGSLSRERAEGAVPAPGTAAAVLTDRAGNGPVLASLPPDRAGATGAAFAVPDPPGAIAADDARCEPEAGESLLDAALAAWTARDWTRASTCFGAAGESIPDRPWIEYMNALALWKGGRVGDAEAVMVHALALDDRCVRCAVNLSRIRNDAGDFEGALEAARAALGVDPDDPDARYLEARSLRNLGRVPEAIDALRALVAERPDHGHARNLLGLSLLESDRETEAVPHLEAARDLMPEVAFVRNNLGMAYERCGDRVAAVVEYRAACDLDGGGGRSAANLARLDPAGTIEAGVLLAAVAPVEEPAEVDETVATEEIEVAEAGPDRSEDADGTDPGTGPGSP